MIESAIIAKSYYQRNLKESDCWLDMPNRYGLSSRYSELQIIVILFLIFTDFIIRISTKRINLKRVALVPQLLTAWKDFYAFDFQINQRNWQFVQLQSMLTRS
jgi:hypothetical protein